MPTPLEIFATMQLTCGFHVKLLSMLTRRPSSFCVWKKELCHCSFFYETFIDSQRNLSRVKKHDNCFVCLYEVC